MARKDGMGGPMPKGSGTDNPNIGEADKVAGKGRAGSIPFLPSPTEYGGKPNNNAAGEVARTTTPEKRFPFLPSKPE